MDEDTDTLSDRSFNHSPYMDQGPDDSTHPNRCMNESPQTDHDDMEDQPESENWYIEHYKENSYWAIEYAGHLWDDNYGWRELKPGSLPEPWWIEDPPPRSPSDPDYLCDVCRHINFCWLFENNASKPKSHREREISIGTERRVWEQTNCSFCVLLAPICWVEPWLEDETVNIESKSYSGFLEFDYNHPETEVKYLSVSLTKREIDLQVLDDSRPMRGRQISSHITEEQQNIARQWLEKCEHEHRNGEDAVLVPDLALIDLNQSCIVRPHGPVRYAALSYVWGKSPQKMYTKSTKRWFETKGALHSKQGFLPQTITDAMDLAAHIGLDYLWVDSLCILQDDEVNRNYFISRMGSIYGAAAITIVDANGNHAGSGLAGMSSPRRNSQKISTVQGMQLCTTACSSCKPWNKFPECAWLERGWTYQEMLLSKRLLLVTREQLLFVCNHTVFLEETHAHIPRMSDWTMPSDPSVKIRRSEAAETPILYLYDAAVGSFTERDLTHDVDVIPAFDAIFKVLYKNTGAKSLFNLPDVEIEEALLWGSGSQYETSASVSVRDWSKMARRRHPDRVPTWSWAGWRGDIKYYRTRIADTPLISAVLWRCDPTSAVNKRSELALQDYRCANWREKGWNYRFLPDWNSYAYTHDSRPNILFTHPIPLKPHAGPHKLSFLDDSNVLHFSAFTVHISASITISGLCLDDRAHFFGGKRRHILDPSQYGAGLITLDCLPANEVDLRLVALARCSKGSIQDCEKQLGIDLRKIAPLDWDPKYFENISQPRDTDKPNPAFYGNYASMVTWDRGRFQDKFYPLYSVLLVEVREGIAYRIGMGEVHIDAFHAVNPIWEEVRLG